jgi:hypothetical protein
MRHGLFFWPVFVAVGVAAGPITDQNMADCGLEGRLPRRPLAEIEPKEKTVQYAFSADVALDSADDDVMMKAWNR